VINPAFTQPVTVTRYPVGSSIVFSAILVAGNAIAMTVNNAPVGPVTFAVDAPTTMAALAAAIAAAPGVTSALVNTTSPRRIDILPGGVSLAGIAVTGGATQATASLYGGHFAGNYSPPLPLVVSITASVQPVSGFELLQFSEGERTRGLIKLYSDQPLYTADESLGTQADLLTVGGVVYQVRQVLPWSGPLPHYKAIAVRRDPLPG
jgi:hypothetical protein